MSQVLCTSGSFRKSPVVSVLTPTITGRGVLFLECLKSVSGQSFGRREHLYVVDEERQGCAAMMNRLARCAVGDWLLPLADDDILLPYALRHLVDCAKENRGKIVYSPPLVWGEPPDQFLGSPPGIPATALIPREVWERLAGYDERLGETEDRDLWARAQDARVEFVRFSEAPTWVYRFHGGNKSRNKGVAS